MKLVRGWKQGQKHAPASVVTIGNFDGVHLGHQALIEATCARARKLGVAAVLMTFEPLPGEFFNPRKFPARITATRKKLQRLGQSGLDVTWLIRFDKDLASLGPEQFVQQMLIEQLGVREIVIGEDFRFGKNRAGDVAMLEKLGQQSGYAVCTIDAVLGAGKRISSTLIREKLAVGDMQAANAALGWRYSMGGRVQHGSKLGRKLGFPTANIGVKCSLAALDGIFAVRAVFAGAEQGINGVASLGQRPTVDDSGDKWLEVHLFDYSGDLYGQRLDVEFVEKLRDIEKYDTLDALIEQMKSDDKAAREILRCIRP